MTQGSGQSGTEGQPGDQGLPGSPPEPGFVYPQGNPYGALVYPPMGQYRGGMIEPPMDRPGSLTAAAVLGYVQAGITLIATMLVFVGAFGAGPTVAVAVTVIIALAQLAGVGLLILGSVRLMSGTSRAVYLSAVILELAICFLYLISGIAVAGVNALPNVDVDSVEAVKGLLIIGPVLFAVMPAIGLGLVLGKGVTAYLRAARGR